MTKMAALSLRIFSGTKKDDDLETWYAAFDAPVLICTKDDPGLKLISCMARFNLVPNSVLF